MRSRTLASDNGARDASGKLSVQEVTKEGLGGTAVGALIGGLAGLPLGPLAVTIGAARGALIGGSADLTNEGADTKFAEKISRELAPGKADERQVQAIGRTHLIHRPARDIIPPLGEARVSSYRM